MREQWSPEGSPYADPEELLPKGVVAERKKSAQEAQVNSHPKRQGEPLPKGAVAEQKKSAQ